MENQFFASPGAWKSRNRHEQHEVDGIREGKGRKGCDNKKMEDGKRKATWGTRKMKPENFQRFRYDNEAAVVGAGSEERKSIYALNEYWWVEGGEETTTNYNDIFSSLWIMQRFILCGLFSTTGNNGVGPNQLSRELASTSLRSHFVSERCWIPSSSFSRASPWLSSHT